jgi:glycosyltransferase involved in cell wall biosynthesis
LEENKGVANALNIGIKIASDDTEVEYIARMDADDISLPDRI